MADNINRFLDNYYVEQDSPLVVGEIELKQPEASVTFDKGAGPMQKQSKELFSAINKIYGGYLAAYSKETYKRQFDIYPLRDFDSYMNSLGAVRTNGGRDFKGVGTKTNWYDVIKEERTKRSKIYDNLINEQKIDEKISNDRKHDLDNLSKTFTEKDFDKVAEQIKNQTGFTLPKGELLEFVNKNKSNPDAFLKEYEKSINSNPNITPQIKKNVLDIINSFVKQSNSESISLTKKYKDAKQIEEERKKILKLKDEASKEKTDENQARIKKYEEQIRDLDEQIKQTKVKREQILGKIIKEEEQKKIHRYMNFWENNILERKDNDAINPYDGFTTQGPFCLEKQNYFKNIFRKSMNHYDTEFREADYTEYGGLDEGNDLIEFPETIVTGVLKRKETNFESLIGSPTGFFKETSKNLTKKISVNIDNSSLTKYKAELHKFVTYENWIQDFNKVKSYGDKENWYKYMLSYTELLSTKLKFKISNQKDPTLGEKEKKERDEYNWSKLTDENFIFNILDVDFLAKTILYNDLSGENQNLKDAIYVLANNISFLSTQYKLSWNQSDTLKNRRNYFIQDYKLNIK